MKTKLDKGSLTLVLRIDNSQDPVKAKKQGNIYKSWALVNKHSSAILGHIVKYVNPKVEYSVSGAGIALAYHMNWATAYSRKYPNMKEAKKALIKQLNSDLDALLADESYLPF